MEGWVGGGIGERSRVIARGGRRRKRDVFLTFLPLSSSLSPALPFALAPLDAEHENNDVCRYFRIKGGREGEGRQEDVYGKTTYFCKCSGSSW